MAGIRWRCAKLQVLVTLGSNMFIALVHSGSNPVCQRMKAALLMSRSLFGTARCGRLSYALIVVAILAADFLKTPLESYIGDLHTDAMQRLVSDAEPDAATAVAATGPQAMQQMAQDMNRHLEKEYARRMQEYQAHKAAFPDSGRAPPEKLDMAVAQEWALRQPGLAILPNQNQLQQGQALSAGMNTINSVYVTAIGLIGPASMLAIAWVVLARVRDIGWPAWTGLGVLGVFLIKIWTLQAVSYVVSMALQLLFLALLAGLALIPSGFDFRRKPQQAEAPTPLPDRTSGHAAGPAGRAQFGRRSR